MEYWHIWMLAAVALFIFEIFTTTFVFACLGVGCAAAGVGAVVVGDGYIAQWALFAGAAGVSFAYLRPIALKYLYHKKDAVRTNVDVLAGKIGRVTETIDGTIGTGRVQVGGDDWRARTDDGTTIPVNTRVRVLGLDGISIVVEKE